MDTQNQEDLNAGRTGDESLNTASTGNQSAEETKGTHRKGGIHNNALYAASMGRAATAQVDHHNTRDLAQTGTNISYEGPTAPGGGGSAGSGYTSGQSGADTSISTDSDYDQAAIGRNPDHLDGGESINDKAEDAEDEINEQR